MQFDLERSLLFNRFKRISSESAAFIDAYTLDLFQFQYKYNKIYRSYCDNLGVKNTDVNEIGSIPYLPIVAFKNHEVKCGHFEDAALFISSGTAGETRSSHHVRDVKHYLDNTEQIWSAYFDKPEKYCFLALLPGYLEREGSSLIFMADYFISKSQYDESGFYLRNHAELYEKLLFCKRNNITAVLFGVTYALLDFAENYPIDFPGLIIIETGGMKGQRREMIKKEVHQLLQDAFHVDSIYSEYGMTELFSQAYSFGSQIFTLNKFLKIFVHQVNDPLTLEKKGKPGIISVVDLANIDTCAFIQTEDIGVMQDADHFEVLGRLDAADLRGCNLMIHEI